MVVMPWLLLRLRRRERILEPLAGHEPRTDRRTNAAFVARSRSQALVDAASSAFRITLIEEARVLSSSLDPARLGTSEHALDEPAVDLHGRAGHVRRGVRQQERATRPNSSGSP